MKKSILIVFSFLISLSVKSQTYNDFIKQGDSLKSIKEYNKAVKAYTNAIEIEPENEIGYLKRGKLRKGLGNFELGNKDILKSQKILNIKNRERCSLLSKEKGISVKDTSYDTEYIFEIPNRAKDELYNLSYQYVAEIFKSANDVVQLNDKEMGVILCKGIFNPNYSRGDLFNVHFSLKIETKDNKMRIRIFQQSLSYAPTNVNLGLLSDIFTKRRNGYILKNDFIELDKEIKIHNILFMVDLSDYIITAKKGDNW
jgi:tetratricopeptide (TPR) repeat protein